MRIDETLTSISYKSDLIQDVINKETQKYFKSLDEYMKVIDNEFIKSGSDLPTDILTEFLLNLNSILYWAGNGLEIVSLKESLAKMAKEEAFNINYNKADGTMGDKKAFASIESQKEELVKVAYTNAVKLCQHKIDKATELSSALKKTISYRMANEVKNEV